MLTSSNQHLNNLNQPTNNQPIQRVAQQRLRSPLEDFLQDLQRATASFDAAAGGAQLCPAGCCRPLLGWWQLVGMGCCWDPPSCVVQHLEGVQEEKSTAVFAGRCGILCYYVCFFMRQFIGNIASLVLLVVNNTHTRAPCNFCTRIGGLY